MCGGQFQQGFISNSKIKKLLSRLQLLFVSPLVVWPCAPGQVLDLVVGMLAEVGGLWRGSYARHVIGLKFNTLKEVRGLKVHPDDDVANMIRQSCPP